MSESFWPSIPARVNDWVKSQIKKGIPNGPFCTPVDEPIPSFEQAGCEKVFSGDNDSYIVLGRDRTSSLASGCGGAGMTSCGMIDLVVGRFSSIQAKRIKNGKEPIDKKQKVNPNFAADAARIYITQRTLGIDDDLGFKKEKGPDSEDKSAIAIKSDHTRIVGRESVRIYAGLGRYAGSGPQGETCANNFEVGKGNGKIEFIGGNANEDKLQPAVLGDKLQEYLKKQSDKFQELYEDVMTIHEQLATVNGILGVLETFGGGETFKRHMTKNVNTMVSSVKKSLNTTLEQCNHLGTTVVPGEGSFLSKDVFLT